MIDGEWSSRAPGAGAGEREREPVAEGTAFGRAVRAFRQHAGLSLNQLARQAGVDPAYIHRLEKADVQARAPVPRRGVVLAIAAALGLDRYRTDQLLVYAGYVPEAIVALGGWDVSLALISERLADPQLPGPARAELRELLLLVAQRWARSPLEVGPAGLGQLPQLE